MRKIATILGLGCMFVLGMLAQQGGAADAEARTEAAQGAKRCFNSTLKGAYGIKFEGLSLEGGPFASVSRITFNGRGRFVTSEVGRFNGNLVQRRFSGPYTVREDCTGFLDFTSEISDPPHQAHGEFVIVDGGNEFFVLDNEDGWVASGIGKRL